MRDTAQAEDHGRPADTEETPPSGRSGNGASEGDRIKASPLARRIAKEKGVDLSASERHRSQRTGRQGGCRGCRTRRRTRGGRDGDPAGRRRCRTGRGEARRGTRHPARGDQAQQHPQDDRASPDRIEAAGAAHLPDRRRAAGQAPDAAGRPQCRFGEPRRETVGQRSAGEGARGRAGRGACVQCHVHAGPVDQLPPRRHLGRGVDADRDSSRRW